MNDNAIKNVLEKVCKKFASIADKQARAIIKTLLNLVETLASETHRQQAEIQRLRDELNRLKGEQDKPKIRPQKSKASDISSEVERKSRERKPLKKKSKKKKYKIKVDRTEIRQVDQSQLPPDAVFKGYQSVVIQDITIKTDNIEFRKEVYYSPSSKKTYIATLPAGYQGEFGPGVKTLILNLHHAANMTEPAIAATLANFGIFISAATVSRIITDNKEAFHEEKAEIVQAGLASTDYQHIDDTGARVDGKNYYTHILCNPYFTAYFTKPHKDRLTILEILRQSNLQFDINEQAVKLMEVMQLPAKHLNNIKPYEGEHFSKPEMDKVLNEIFPNSQRPRAKQIILESCAIAAYRILPEAVATLVADDAPQFKLITENPVALCWVHEGRHYKKLNPVVPWHRTQLEDFKDQFWDYYQKLNDFKDSPTEARAAELAKEFDTLFSAKTGYAQLDKCIEKTLAKKESLLVILKNPEIPLHNNPAELGARAQARKRDISFQTKNEKGTQAKDTFMTIVQTANKLGVNIFNYLHDRISDRYEMPSLASLISRKRDSPDIKGKY